MREIRYSVEIHTTRENVWATLWDDKTLREWASIIDPETYMVGELKEGNEVQFISAHGGYGVTSLVEAMIVNEFVLLRHQADTQKNGTVQREKQWTGGHESYVLVEKDGITRLSVTFDMPLELEETFNETYPKALNRIKELAEQKH